MSVAAVIVSYHTGPILADCLKALDDGAVDEIILVDNGNPDEAIETARKGIETPLQLITGHGNIGFAAGCNKGAAAARTDFLLLINPDAMIEKGGVERLIEDGKQLASPWLMGALLVGLDGKEQRGSRRGELTPWRAIFDASKLSRLAPSIFPGFNNHTSERPAELAQIETLSGACLFLPTADYNSIDGMDEGYFLHVEDIDFCKRMRLAGGAVWFNPHVKVTHQKGSSDAPSRFVEAHKVRSKIRYFDTYFKHSWPAPARWLLGRALWAVFFLKTVGRG